MNVNKENIWHFTCDYCQGFWSIATMDDWEPTNLYCTHCGEQNKNEGHIRFGTSSYTRAEDSFQKEICSCGHKVIDCDCAPGCKCGCNRRYLDSETSFDMEKYT
jgi:hypothetical protein